jgi:hypothetical protein
MTTKEEGGRSMLPKKQILLHLRPSGHSEDWVIIATFADEKTADKAAKLMKKKPSTTVLRDGNEVKLRGSSDGWASSGHVREVLLKLGAQKTRMPYDYQEVKVTYTPPKQAPLHILLLLQLITDPEELELVKVLAAKFQKQTRKKDGTFVFRYAGPKIYRDAHEVDDAPNGALRDDRNFLPLTKKFTAKELL